MPKGILYVESHADPAQLDAFHHWYNEIHLAEMTAIDGFTAARRFAPVTGDGPFVTVYEIDADDIDSVRARLTDTAKAGRLSPPVGVRTDIPPVMRYYRDITP